MKKTVFYKVNGGPLTPAVDPAREALEAAVGVEKAAAKLRSHERAQKAQDDARTRLAKLERELLERKR